MYTSLTNVVSQPALSFIRNSSRLVSSDRTASAIRQRFLDYFIQDNNHTFVRSSPVIPYCDPTVAFVNAGMNQFKSIFLGTQEPKYPRVANYQKCVRVGGKHNDLDIVGTDGYHHTFFEMLGNWSFGDYFKSDACELAWTLLTDVYKIPAEKLYVTYFGGDINYGLEEDAETKEIWKHIGVPPERILPFGLKDNFWEMGDTGPCGPCTEIHFDHRGVQNRAEFVNKGLFDLVELWNIVFIQYNKNSDGSISVLPNKHIDTGIGFERLTAVLQNELSNYDTDNFLYLIKAIEKNSKNVKPYEKKYGESDWNNLDASYRTLADHVRMITVCLADGMIPEQNQKLRRIMRKSFDISENVFQNPKGLLKELSCFVVENLGNAYPELETNVQQIHQVITYEEEVYQELRKKAVEEWNEIVEENVNLKSLDILEAPSLIPAFKELKKTKPEKIDGNVAFKLYDTFGLDISTIEKLSQSLELSFDRTGLLSELKRARARSKNQSTLKHSAIFENFLNETIPRTNDEYKYAYSKVDDSYEFSAVDSKVLRILHHDDMVKEIGPNTPSALLLDKTNFYSESGGQVSDKGHIQFEKAKFEITETENLNGYILHKGVLNSKKKSLSIGSSGTIMIDQDKRLNLMRNHTATHLLNAILKRLKGATCQKSSKVTEDYLYLEAGVFGSKITESDIETIEKNINDIIMNKLPVQLKVINSQQLLDMNKVTMIPGEIYPEDEIRLIEILDNNNNNDIISREPCCGTHVLNTSDIGSFSLIRVKSLGRSTTAFHAVTGKKSELAVKNGDKIWNEVCSLEKNMQEKLDEPHLIDMAVSSLRRKISSEDLSLLPAQVKYKCLNVLHQISKKTKNLVKNNLNDIIDMEMKNAIVSEVETTKSNKKYLIHYLRTSMILEHVPLNRATRYCKDIPTLIISYTDNTVHARCCVPKEFCNDKFSAEKWMKESVLSTFKDSWLIANEHNKEFVCNMKSKRINIQDWDLLLKRCLDTARTFVERNL